MWTHVDRAFEHADQAFAKADEAFAEANQAFAEADVTTKSTAHRIRFRACSWRERWRLTKKFVAMTFDVLVNGQTEIRFKCNETLGTKSHP